jgi:hypothetical protein
MHITGWGTHTILDIKICVFDIYSGRRIGAAGVGNPFPNGGTRAGVPHTRVLALMSVPIWGPSVEMI